MKKLPPDMPPDVVLWHAVTKTVKPYHAKNESIFVTVGAADRAAGTGKPRKNTPILPDKTVSESPLPPSAGFDRATATKMKKGKLVIDGRIDLHGMSQERAFSALSRFIESAVKQEHRTLLVITGKGAAGGGVLRKSLPLWLTESGLQRYVLALAQAQPKDGGGGAFYIRLRKNRKK